MYKPKILLALCALLATVALPAQMVTKYLYEFDTLGAGHPGDQINDHLAFRAAAAFFQAHHGYGTLILEDGEYIIGRQQLHWEGTPLPGPEWINYHYPEGANPISCPSLVALQPGFTLDSCFNFTVQGGTNTSIRYRDCLYYGSFLRTPGTDDVYAATGIDQCYSCQDSAHFISQPDLLHAKVGSVFTFVHCDSITVRDLELNGNLDNAILGGWSSVDGIQTDYDGVILYESSRCTIDNVDAHHFGRDGLFLWALYSDTTNHFADEFPALHLGIELADSATTTPGNYTLLFNNNVVNSSFNWNGRQGISWTGMSGLNVTNCDLNYNGAGRFSSSPGTGLDIEGLGGPLRVRHGTFDNCSFLHNLNAGIHSDNGTCIGQQDFTFDHCVIKAGEGGVAIWPKAHDMDFYDCEIYGSMKSLYEQAENIPRDPDRDLLFRRTNFYEEDDQWSYLIGPDSIHWNSECGTEPYKPDMISSGVGNVTYDSCGFYTNCLGQVIFRGRSRLETTFPYCQSGVGPYLGSDTAQDARYIRVTNCFVKNTGRKRCGPGTRVLAGDYVTVNNLTVDIPTTVRDSLAPGDHYILPFGLSTNPGPPCVYGGFCTDIDTLYTVYPSFPPCLPFYQDTVDVTWDPCTGVNQPVQACLSDANCYSDLAIADSTLSSTLASPVGGTVYVEGLFIVDQDFTFENATVKMAPGAEIVVQAGATLYAETSSIASCNNVMWKSITVDSTAVLKMTNCYVNDAENTITALDGSVVLLDGNQFRNNRVVVQVPFQANVAAYNVSIYAVNNTVYSAGAMPAPYPGQTTLVGLQGYAAFDIDRISLDLTAGPNLIHNMSNGIVAVQCDLGITETTFLHIQPDPAYAHYANGSAIYARGPKSFHTLKQAGFGTGSTAAPSFGDCYWGIYTEYMNVYSSDNFMLDVGTAYRVDRSGYMHVQIHDNRLDTRRDGIVLAMNDGAAQLLVEHNDITFAQNLPPGQYTKGYFAIRVYEANTLNPDSKIQNNTIHYRQGASTAYGGIGLVSANKYLVANNSMHMTDNASNKVGVLLNGCNAPEVSCNDVYGANNGYPDLGQSGIRNFKGYAPLISCNTVDNTTNGMLFSGESLDAEVRGNEFHHHKYGLHLELNAIIGPQDHRGNLWLQPAQVWGAWCEDTVSAVNNLIKVDPGLPNNMPTTVSPSFWFDVESGTTFSCADSLGECVGYKERCTDCPKEIYEQIAEGSIENGDYTDQTRWTLEGDLYDILRNAEGLLDDPVMQEFYESVQSTVAAQLKDLDDSLLVLFELDSTILVQLQQNRYQLAVLQLELKLALQQLAEPNLTEAQQAALRNAINGLQQDMNDPITYNTTALDLAANTQVLTAAGIRNTNTAIAAGELPETNYRTVNDIYLSTVAMDVDEFTEQQAIDLFDVANQCPLLGGNAVFEARALYYLIDPREDFDDPTLCLQEGLITKNLKDEGARSVSMVPNPASDQATLMLSEALEQGGQLVLYNALGAPSLSMRIQADQQRTLVNTSGLGSGVYHYQVSTGDNLIGEGRLTITR